MYSWLLIAVIIIIIECVCGIIVVSVFSADCVSVPLVASCLSRAFLPPRVNLGAVQYR